jgi:DNA-binding SARP family transcriptional activator/tetratricopeptide (TPR) repeat protein
MNRGNRLTGESAPGLHVRLLGPVGVSRGGAARALPSSRKLRALLAYLALEPAPVSRSRLCDLLWDVPNDPRGELRWYLSKLRNLLDDEDRSRVVASERDLIALDLSDCSVDALEIDTAVDAGIAAMTSDDLRALLQHFGGDLLEGVQIDGNPEFAGWLSARRQRYRNTHVAVLRELTARAPAGSEETFRHLEAWLHIAPFDQRAHEAMLAALLLGGCVHDAEEHIAATIRSFEHEQIDWSALRDAWQVLRATAATPAARVQTASVTRLEAPPVPDASRQRRASIAVMPFADRTNGDAARDRIADGLSDDIITRLAKLRVLFVIARGTTYALRDRGIDAQQAGRLLNVEYVVTGSLRRQGDRVAVAVELAETQQARIVWTDVLEGVADDTFSVLDDVVDRIVAAIAEEIETAESRRALLKPPSSLDAWEAYHRGLWHMYKFNAPDNREAAQFFRGALDLDPTFSRAYAGLSFTHFQNAFLDLTPDREHQIDLAFESAGRSVDADDRDPAAHWAMGRALWLRGLKDESLTELGRSIELSPNFALGHYTLGFVQSQLGDPHAAIDATNYSRQLSPFDPLQFAMLASRALAHIRLGEMNEAAEFAVKATGRPNAHTHILAIAAASLVLAGRRDEARAFVARIRERVPSYDMESFLRAFRFERDTQQLFRRAARQIGFGR